MFRLGYRPALDGVRGIAVLLVVLGHTHWRGIEGGGFVGVPLFFLLSGFLITVLLLEEYDAQGRIDLFAFYRRRAYRLLPAVTVLVVAVAVYLIITGRPGQAATLSAAVLLYVANFFAASGGALPFLGHTWSLSLEEQYYLVWPVVLLLCLRRRVPVRWLVAALLALAGASALARLGLWAAGAPDPRLQYAPDTRVDAILVGCVLAFAVRRWAACRLPLPLLLVAAAVLAVGVVTLGDPDIAYPYGLSCVTAAGAAVLFWALTCSPQQRRWLERPALVRVGRLSYGLYLWHIPVMTGGDTYLEVLPEPYRTVLLIGASWVAAEVSWRLVEQPLLARGRRRASERLAVPAQRLDASAHTA